MLRPIAGTSKPRRAMLISPDRAGDNLTSPTRPASFRAPFAGV